MLLKHGAGCCEIRKGRLGEPGRWRVRAWKFLVACVVLACSVAPLSGEERTFYGAGNPLPFRGLDLSWDRPPVDALPGAEAFWESTTFYVDTTGSYELRHAITPSEYGALQFPRVLLLYAQAFDPAQPQKNLLATLDLSDGRDEAVATWGLLAHSMYELVLSTVDEARPTDSEGYITGVETTLSGPGKILRNPCRFTDDVDSHANAGSLSEAAFVSLPFDGFEQICADVSWWEDGADDSEANLARVSPLRTENSALYYFFDPQNWEINLKVLDGCAINGHYWVLASSSTDVRFRITMRWLGKKVIFDRDSPYFVPFDPAQPELGGGDLVYEYPGGGPASAFIDVLAFHCDRPF